MPSKQSKPTRLKGQELRKFRSAVAKLKAAGVTSKRVDARSQVDTRYMRSKVKRFNDVIEGRATAIKVTKKNFEPLAKYVINDVFEVRDNRVIVPKGSEKDIVSVRKDGKVEVVRKLKNGKEATVYWPIKMADMDSLLEQLTTDPTLDGYKNEDELFSFRIDGNNAEAPFQDAKEMGNYMRKYRQRDFMPIITGAQVREKITFQRFKPIDNSGNDPNPNKATIRKPYPLRENWPKNKRQKERQSEKQRRKIANETPTQREKRLAKKRLNSARMRQRKFLGD